MSKTPFLFYGMCLFMFVMGLFAGTSLHTHSEVTNPRGFIAAMVLGNVIGATVNNLFWRRKFRQLTDQLTDMRHESTKHLLERLQNRDR